MIFSLSRGAHGQVAIPSPAGTWRVALCRPWAPCSIDDTTRVLSRGLLVLNSTPFATTAFSDPGLLHLSDRANADGRPNPNGCFNLNATKPAPSTWLVFVTWTSTVDRTLVVRVNGVDSFDEVLLTVASDGQAFRGTQHFVGRGANPIDTPDAIVVGQRIGVASTAPCLQAAAAARRAANDSAPELPTVRGTRIFPASIDPRAGYILYFWDALADPNPPAVRCVYWGPPAAPGPCFPSEVSGYFGPFMTFGRSLAPPGTYVIAAAPNVTSVATQVDSSAARARRLFAAGVPPSHLVLIGSGRATEIVRRLAVLLPDSVAVAFIGDCGDIVHAVIPGARAVFDANEATSPASSHCGSWFSKLPGSVEYVLPSWYDPSFRDGSDDWLDVARRWIATRIGSSK